MKTVDYAIADNVKAFSTLRHEGFSSGPYSSFNANEFCGDDIENVAKNRELLCNYLQISPNNLVVPHQTHHTNILIVEDVFEGKTSTEKRQLLEDKDALICNIPGICICVSTADCIPVIIYDTVGQVSACIHAGWRGTCARICKKAIKTMISVFGTAPCNCKAVIGPGISLKNFEVGDEVYEEFSKNGFPMDCISQRQKKWHIDLKECNRLQLLSEGILEENIEVCDICTFDNTADFFSARRLGIASGRILTGILIKQ